MLGVVEQLRRSATTIEQGHLVSPCLRLLRQVPAEKARAAEHQQLHRCALGVASARARRYAGPTVKTTAAIRVV